MRFCGLQLEDEVPDHSVVCRFRKALNETNAWEALLAQINSQLSKHNVLVKAGSIAIVDASVTPTLRKPKGKPIYILPETPDAALSKQDRPGVDQQGR